MSEVDEYVYLGVTVRDGIREGIKCIGDRVKEANRVIGMIKYAASRSGCRYVVGREGWEGLVVNILVYDVVMLVL